MELSAIAIGALAGVGAVGLAWAIAPFTPAGRRARARARLRDADPRPVTPELSAGGPPTAGELAAVDKVRRAGAIAATEAERLEADLLGAERRRSGVSSPRPSG